ncbi:hypothetical protein AK812_SmicGene27102 [Symbiodinium microadriaticum]|uniref:Uncharacterized protein n=1 Tax=Symbiodinium microadriaticum TaxID=2951 RepID=A0A1Q9D7N2_SYMMI|nr:hypothetical protein AK812_SmicGene27102 [Symbiodinium microadriaticum]
MVQPRCPPWEAIDRSQPLWRLSMRRRMIRQQRRKERDEDERVRRSHRLPQDVSRCLRAAAVRGDGQYC